MAQPNDPGATISPRLRQAGAIILLGFWIYWPALHGGWITDDYAYLPQNPLLGDPARLWKIWFAPGSLIEYYPVLTTVHLFLWNLFGNATTGYHVVNLLLHLTSAMLLWRLLSKLGLKLAWIGALLFVVSPAQVESVATIAELKNTLSLPPFLLAMYAWIDFEEQGRPRDYLLALGFFLLAMLCKISMAPFPVVILLYAWWKRNRLGLRDLVHTVPFFVISLGLGVLTHLCGEWFVQQRHLPEEVIPSLSLAGRIALAGQSLAYYFLRCFWPGGLLPTYPQWQVSTSPLAFAPWVVLAGLLVWLWTRRATWGRHALLGLGFFVLMIGPFLGLNQISYMSYTWVMDHFLYIAIIGPIGLVVALMEAISARLAPNARYYASFAAAVLLIPLVVAGWFYAGMFKDQETLWSYTLEHNPNDWAARNNLGSVYLVSGRTDEAIDQYRQALALQPTSFDLHSNLALALAQSGHLPEALDELDRALRIWPSAPGFAHRGDLLIRMGRAADALAEYQKAVALDPDNAQARYALGDFAAQSGRFPEAMEQYQAALRGNPGFAPAHINLGNIYFQSGQIPQAIVQYRLALASDPSNANTHLNLGSALVKSGQIPAAIEQYQAALAINPGLTAAQTMIERLQAIPVAKP
jgi:tetratricopeptide (TPR) repeat protein